MNVFILEMLTGGQMHLIRQQENGQNSIIKILWIKLQEDKNSSEIYSKCIN